MQQHPFILLEPNLHSLFFHLCFGSLSSETVPCVITWSCFSTCSSSFFADQHLFNLNQRCCSAINESHLDMTSHPLGCVLLPFQSWIPAWLLVFWLFWQLFRCVTLSFLQFNNKVKVLTCLASLSTGSSSNSARIKTFKTWKNKRKSS